MNVITRWAKQLLFDNAVSRLVSTTVQAALDELAGLVAALGSTPQNPTPGTFLVSGGRLVYKGTGYQYTVTAGTGYINGQPISWTQQDVTLAASDPTNDRIDTFVVNASGVVSAIQGTPASAPSEPSVDPTIYLPLNIAIVYANTSTPTGTTLTTLYDGEGSDWTVTTSAPARINLTSTADHYSGTHCIVATAATAGDTITMARPSGATDFSTLFDLLSLFLKITTAWGNNRSLSVQAYNGTVKVGNAVSIIPGQNGLSNSLLTTWQGQGFLKASFAIAPAAQADRFVFTVVGGAITFRMDLVQLTKYGGEVVVSGGGISQADADARYAQRANNLSDLTSAATARTNLGLGSAAMQNTSAFDAAGAAAAAQAASQPLDAELTALAALTSAANKILYFTGSGAAGLLDLDTDGTLAANSDLKIATQKAVKTAIAAAVTGLLDFKGATDCSANPNYPAASKGDSYVVSVAGKIGGGSGVAVDVGDVFVASADNAGGTQASVGTSWFVLEHNLAGALLAANNLSDIASPSAARSSLGLVIGTDVQAHDADLDTWATKTPPSGAAVGDTDTQTLTNKRVTKRTGTTASSATPTINTDNVDYYSITALAVAVTSFTTNLSGTPTIGQLLWIAIKDDGTARAITWGASFAATGNVALPTTTVASTELNVGFKWDGSVWRCVAVA